ncbi:MAG: hypothetical protein Q9167_003756 [Letrouitia subvulpina]
MSTIGYSIDAKYMSQLGRINEDFKNCLRTETFVRNIVCFYERLPATDKIFVVKSESATLPHFDATGLNANHFDMTKFSTESNTNYQIVLQRMKSMYCLADKSMKVLMRHSLNPNLRGRLRNLPTMPDGCEELIVSMKGSPRARNTGRLALISEDQGHFQISEEKFKEAIKFLIFSPQCSREIRNLGQFALTLGDQSSAQDTEERFQRTLKQLCIQISSEPDDAVTLFCLQKLASLLCQRGQYKHAEYCGRCCLEARLKISGSGSVPTLLTADNLITSMKHQGRYQDAYNLLRDALEGVELPFSDNVSHVKLLDTLAKLALESKMYIVAESFSCDVLRNSICLYGNQHPFTLNRISDLAAILARTGHLASAEAISRRALDGLEQALGTDHPDSLKAACRLADYIRFQKRFEDASLRLKRILKTQRMRIGDFHPDTLFTMRSLGAVYALQGYWKDAEVLLCEALMGQEKCFGKENSHTLWTENALNGVKQLQNEVDLTEELVRSKLYDLFEPKPRSTSEDKRPGYFITNTPFQTPLETAIFRSAAEGDQKVLTDILANENVDQRILGRALREAAAGSQETMVNLLLRYNAPINAQSGYHGTALHAASFAGSKAIVKLLLKENADVNQEGGIFSNAIRAALLGEHETILDVLNILLDCTGTRRPSQSVLNSSLPLALHTGDVAIISRLLEAGADINAEDSLFGSPLQQASFFGQGGIIEMLLDRNADIQKRAGIFPGPLQVAIETQNKSAIRQLLKAGATVGSSQSNHLISVPDRPKTVDEQEEWAKILLEHLADSLRCMPPSSRVSTWDPLQSSPQQPNLSLLRRIGPEIQDVKLSPSLSETTAIPKKAPRLRKRSTIKRMFTFKSGGNKDRSANNPFWKGNSRKKSEQAERPLRKRFSIAF